MLLLDFHDSVRSTKWNSLVFNVLFINNVFAKQNDKCRYTPARKLLNVATKTELEQMFLKVIYIHI